MEEVKRPMYNDVKLRAAALDAAVKRLAELKNMSDDDTYDPDWKHWTECFDTHAEYTAALNEAANETHRHRVFLLQADPQTEDKSLRAWAEWYALSVCDLQFAEPPAWATPWLVLKRVDALSARIQKKEGHHAHA